MIGMKGSSESKRFGVGNCGLVGYSDGTTAPYKIWLRRHVRISRLRCGVRRRFAALACGVVFGLVLTALTGCSFLSTHHFALPTGNWRSRSGQLMYRTGQMTVVGDVVVRSSKSGDFELTFSKGPGINLFTIEQDATFAQVKSSLSHLSWSGPVDRAPTRSTRR